MLVTPEEWLKTPDENGEGLLRVFVDGDVPHPLPLETFGVRPEDVTLGEKQDFEILLEVDECLEDLEIFKDADEYCKRRKENSLAPEAVIPAGLFPLYKNIEFTPSGYVLLNGKVIEICDDPASLGFDEDDLLFNVSCLGSVYTVVHHGEEKPKLSLNNIVSGAFFAQGWPKETN